VVSGFLSAIDVFKSFVGMPWKSSTGGTVPKRSFIVIPLITPKRSGIPRCIPISIQNNFCITQTWQAVIVKQYAVRRDALGCRTK